MKKILDFDIKALCGETGEVVVSTVEANIREIAVIGIAVKMPMAEDIHGFWNNIRGGTDCIRQLPTGRKADADAFLRFMNYESADYAEIAYLEEIDKFDCGFFGISPKEAGLMDPNQKLFLETAWKAIEDAGYGGQKLIGSRTGIYVGYGGAPQYKNVVDRLEPQYSAMAAPGNEAPIIASRIAYLLDLKGPSMLVNTSCSSSLVAIHLACQGIRNGECTLAIAGGIKLHLLNLKQRGDIGIMSSDGRTRTFDQQSDGTGNGEGVAAILLKPLQKALEDGDGIYAVIRGSAVNQDGASNGITSPNPEAQEDVIARAWENAGIDPETISYIEAHGTGTKLGDPIEIEGIRRAFRKYTDKKQFCAVGSVKSNIGHLDNTAGIAGFIKAVLALQYGELPPTLHFNVPNRKIEFDDSPVYVNDRLKKWDTEGFPRKCGVSSFGLSGTNCHIILEEAPRITQVSYPDEHGAGILTLSAKSKDALQKLTKQYKEFISTNAGCNWKDICYTANTGRWHHPYRLAAIAGGKEDLACKLGKLADSWEEGLLEPGVFYGEKKAAAPFAVVERKEVPAGVTAPEDTSTVCSIRQFISGGKRDKDILQIICERYASGAEIDWNELYLGEGRKHVHLPAYPFDKTRCVIEVPERKRLASADPVQDMFFASSWKYEPLSLDGSGTVSDPVLIFLDGKGIGSGITQKLKEEGTEVIEVAPGKEFVRTGRSKYEIGAEPADLDKLLMELKERNITRIIHLLSITEDRKPAGNIEQLEQALDKGVISLSHLVKAIYKADAANPVDLVCISEYAAKVTGREKWIHPENASMFALGKVIFMENPGIRCRCIDIDAYTDIMCITEEVKAGYQEYMVAYRRNERFVEELERCNIDCIQDSRTEIRQNGVYLVTGGAGRLGLEICKYLARDRQVRIIMINRSVLAERNLWDDIAAAGPDSRTAAVIGTIREIEGNGSEVAYYSADVTNETEISTVLENVRNRYGKIDGVIHCAAVGVGKEGERIIHESEKSLRQGLAPKIQGTWLLHSLTQNDVPDFFVLFSSAITVMGGIGAAAYTAANSYLDSFADYRNKTGGRVLAINWPMWRNESDPAWYMQEKNQMFEGIRPAEAIRAFDRLLHKRTARILAGKWNFESEIHRLEKYMPFRISDGLKEEIIMHEKGREIKKESQRIAVKLAGRENRIYSDTEIKLASIYGNVLGLNEINITDSFAELGGNSIIAIKIETDMESQGIPMGITEIYRYGTVEKLAFHLGNPEKDPDAEKIEKQDTKKEDVFESCSRRLPDTGKIEPADADGHEIPNIEPFNDFYYKSCYYNSLFPVIRHYNREIQPFLANDVIVYEYLNRPHEVAFTAGQLPMHSDEHILDSLGILMQAKIYSGDVLGDIRRAISREKPVIVWVDCFYEPLRYDTWQKKHLQHTWLVYGCDECDRTCSILEHKHKDSLSYGKRVIGWQDLIRCYNGFNENYNPEGKISSYMEYSCLPADGTGVLTDLSAQKTGRDHFAANMFKHRAVIFEGLKQLKRFAEDIQNTDIRQPEWTENIKLLFESLNHIVNVKRVEAHRTAVFFDAHKELVSLSAEIVENWELIRTQIGKFIFTSVFTEELPEILIEKLLLIYQAEYKFNLNLFSKSEIDDGSDREASIG